MINIFHDTFFVVVDLLFFVVVVDLLGVIVFVVLTKVMLSKTDSFV